MSQQPSPGVRMRGQTVLVTGTTKGGIGYETARLLGDEGATVLTHGRTQKAAGVSVGSGGEARIGAMTTLSELEHDQSIAKRWPVLTYALHRLSNPRVRNVARVGGALAHGDPHMDLPPVLSSLGAKAIVAGPSGRREIMVEELFSGYYETVLKRDELITFVDVPPQAGWTSTYIKCTTRSADDWPALGIACSLRIEGDTIGDVRLMISAATEKLTRLVSTEKVLRGQNANEATFERAGEAHAFRMVAAKARGRAFRRGQCVDDTGRRRATRRQPTRGVREGGGPHDDDRGDHYVADP